MHLVDSNSSSTRRTANAFAKKHEAEICQSHANKTGRNVVGRYGTYRPSQASLESSLWMERGSR